jgi:hypothetical protein
MVNSNDFSAGIRKEMIRFERNNKILASGDSGSILGANYFFPRISNKSIIVFEYQIFTTEIHDFL